MVIAEIQVSVDYLTKPPDVFKEMSRILEPGALAIMSFSNRCFWTKAISIWTSTGDTDHALIIGSYFHYAGGFEPPQAVDISPNPGPGPGRSDPMFPSRPALLELQLYQSWVWSLLHRLQSGSPVGLAGFVHNDYLEYSR
ncbi:hypothetical protein V6N12_018161 [Hibiscus sabdariffa]|uniref:Methyltransferase type 11 domain-containing protein n=1 Tax=Hibiscus sabdariffa TaxID=183260 RepID=A0ABR2BPK0_9ROSI